MLSFYFVLSLLCLSILNSFLATGALSWSLGFLYIGYDTALLIFVSFQMLKVIRTQAGVRSSAVFKPSIAVLITARNEETVLFDCLNALLNQSDAPEQIVWIDDGSTDATLLKLEVFQTSHPNKLRVFSKPHTGKASSLNAVWPKIDAEILVTIDADTMLEPDAIAEIRLAFAHNLNLAASGGLLTPRSIQNPKGIFELFQRFEYIRSFLSRRAWSSKNALLLVSGAFAAYRKKAVLEVGGYDEKSFVEDYDLIHRIHRYSHDHGLNYEVDVTVRARAVTDVPGSLKPFLKQRQRWFAGFLQTQFKNSDMIGNKKYGSVGTFMLRIKSADTLQPWFGVLALITLVFFIFSHRKVPALVGQVLLAKIILDLFFHYLAVALYYRWQDKPPPPHTWFLSTLSTFLEPVTFQIFRHTGALYGWIAFFRTHSEWTPQRKGNSKV